LDASKVFAAFPRMEEIVLYDPKFPVPVDITSRVPIITIIFYKSHRGPVIISDVQGELRIKSNVPLLSIISPGVRVKKLVLDWEGILPWADVLAIPGLEELEIISHWYVDSARDMLSTATQRGLKRIACRTLVHEDDVCDISALSAPPEYMITGIRSWTHTWRAARGRVRGANSIPFRVADAHALAHYLVQEMHGESLCIPISTLDDPVIAALPGSIREITLMTASPQGLRKYLDALPASVRSLGLVFDLPLMKEGFEEVLRDFFRVRVIPRFDATLGIGCYFENACAIHEKSLARVKVALALLGSRLKNDVIRLVAEKIPLNL
jgi:hypothetical protein